LCFPCAAAKQGTDGGSHRFSTPSTRSLRSRFFLIFVLFLCTKSICGSFLCLVAPKKLTTIGHVCGSSMLCAVWIVAFVGSISATLVAAHTSSHGFSALQAFLVRRTSRSHHCLHSLDRHTGEIHTHPTPAATLAPQWAWQLAAHTNPTTIAAALCAAHTSHNCCVGNSIVSIVHT